MGKKGIYLDLIKRKAKEKDRNSSDTSFLSKKDEKKDREGKWDGRRKIVKGEKENLPKNSREEKILEREGGGISQRFLERRGRRLSKEEKEMKEKIPKSD